MSQGMYTAVSGIRANQTRLNVIANNIANVNTLGFKGSLANFATVFASTISGGTPPNGVLGGTNPRQLGNGALVSEIASNWSQGGTQFTGRNTDLSINGDGFFAVERIDVNNPLNTDFYLTRAGNFTLDSSGNLVTTSGNRVRGTSQLSGSAATTLGRINIPRSFQVTKEYDATPAVQNITYSPINTPAATIATDVSNLHHGGGAIPGSLQTLQVQLVSFSIAKDGAISAKYSNGDIITVRTDANTANQAVINGDPSLTRTEIVHRPYEGGDYPANNFVAGDNPYGGTVQQAVGREVFTGGVTPIQAGAMEGMQMQIQTASVTNPAGMLYDGNNNFLMGANAGQAQFGVAGTGSRGSIDSGALESSNVDLSGEFTNMIISQRGLEAASKVIRSQSEVMQTIIQMV